MPAEKTLIGSISSAENFAQNAMKSSWTVTQFSLGVTQLDVRISHSIDPCCILKDFQN